MNALLRTPIHSLWLGKYSRVLRTRSIRPLDMVRSHAFGVLRSVPPARVRVHPQRRLVALAARIHE